MSPWQSTQSHNAKKINISSDVSRSSEISIQCYLRKDQPKRGVDGLADDMGNNDIFMGSLKFTPDFDNMGSEDQWYNLIGGGGKVKLGTSYQPTYVGSMPCLFVNMFRSLRSPSRVNR